MKSTPEHYRQIAQVLKLSPALQAELELCAIDISHGRTEWAYRRLLRVLETTPDSYRLDLMADADA